MDDKKQTANSSSENGGSASHRLDVSAIYPTPIKDSLTEPTSRLSERAMDRWPREARSDKLIKIFIQGGGVLAIVLGLGSLVFPVVVTGSLIAGVSGITGAVIGISMGLGLILRKELARIGVIILMTISMLSLLVGVSGYFGRSFIPNNQIHCSSASECQSQAQDARSGRPAGVYLTVLILGGLGNIGVLVFLTRPAVRRQFD